MVVQASVYNGSHLAYAAALVFPSLEYTDVDVMGKMWLILQY